MKARSAIMGICLAGMVLGPAVGGCARPAGVVNEVKTAKELKVMMASKDVLLIHAFDAEDYARRHLPGAVNVDYEKMEPSMLPADKDKAMVFYCTGGMCPVGRLAASKAAEWGYRNAWVYSGGMSDWQGAGLALESRSE
jgi:rhodanese-related sulfurtransferase